MFSRLHSLRILLLIGFLVVLFFVLFLISLFSGPDEPSVEQTNSNPASSGRSGSVAVDQSRPFEVLSSAPTEDLRINEPVTFAFSLPVKLEDIVISVEPPIVIKLQLDPSSMILSVLPESYWQPSTEYTIKILNKTLSVNGKRLEGEQVVQFKTETLGGM